MCKNSTDRHHLNILKIIEIIYHMHIEYEFYILAYDTDPGVLYEHELIYTTMGKWYDHYKFTKIFRDQNI